jgi:hypothetical protein
MTFTRFTHAVLLISSIMGILPYMKMTQHIEAMHEQVQMNKFIQ